MEGGGDLGPFLFTIGYGIDPNQSGGLPEELLIGLNGFAVEMVLRGRGPSMTRFTMANRELEKRMFSYGARTNDSEALHLREENEAFATSSDARQIARKRRMLSTR